MTDSQPKKGGKNLTTSLSRKMRYQHYTSSHLREQHKIKRILQSCGYKYAQEWASKHGALAYLSRLVAK